MAWLGARYRPRPTGMASHSLLAPGTRGEGKARRGVYDEYVAAWVAFRRPSGLVKNEAGIDVLGSFVCVDAGVGGAGVDVAAAYRDGAEAMARACAGVGVGSAGAAVVLRGRGAGEASIEGVVVVAGVAAATAAAAGKAEGGGDVLSCDAGELTSEIPGSPWATLCALASKGKGIFDGSGRSDGSDGAPR